MKTIVSIFAILTLSEICIIYVTTLNDIDNTHTNIFKLKSLMDCVTVMVIIISQNKHQFPLA